MTISMNLMAIGIIAVSCFLMGWFVRRKQLAALQKRVIELECEMLNNHAEILELQKEKARFSTTLSASLNNHQHSHRKHIA